MSEVRELTVPGRYDSIPKITQFISEVAQAAGLSEKESYHCQMSVDEACTNVIEHAYGGEGKGDIKLVCTLDRGICKIEIVDAGEPFDPASVPEPKIHENIEDMKPGGIGLHLMRQLMDEVEFKFIDGTNRLTLIKKHDESAPPPKEPIPVEVTDGVTVVSPVGRLDSSVSPELEETLSSLINTDNIKLVVDFSNVTYISSRGLKAIVTAWRMAKDRGGVVVLSSIAPHVKNIIDTVGFNQVFEIFETIDEATRHFT